SSGYIYIILKTENSKLAEDETYTVRHILITPESKDSESTDTEEEEYTDKEWQAAKKKADSILEKFNKGDKTEYSFALLAEENTADTASTSASSSDMFGGLYEGVALGQMVPSFEEWATDKSRKYGDTGIVKSDYGYHIMYFINNTPEYKANIITALRNERFDEMVKNANVKVRNSVVERAVSENSKASDDSSTAE
ncbi:MAG: peptidylprolyl isomerase, partial [Eubacterium sp.]